MRRTMETAYHLFKNHPDFNDIKFIIVPKAKEGIKASSDIPGNIDSIISEFSEKFPNLNDDLFKEYSNRLDYFLEDLQPDLINTLSPKITSKDDDCIGNNIYELLKEISKLTCTHFIIVTVTSPGKTESKFIILIENLIIFL
jgi:hypothetical protein